MAAFIWILASLFQVQPVSGDLPPPVMNITSKNFVHMLEWEAGPGSPAGVYYQVSFMTAKGTFWEPVASCAHVTRPLLCNLTGVFPDHHQTYFTQITARLANQTSSTIHPGFEPLRDTVLEPPLVSVTPCGKNLCVDLRSPLPHLTPIYKKFNYQLRVQSNSATTPQFFLDSKTLGRTVLKDLSSGRSYCVSARVSNGIVQRQSDYGQPRCASTPGAFNDDALISVPLCILVLSVLVVLVLSGFAGYFCLRTHLPTILTSIRHQPKVLVLVPETVSLSVPVLVEAPSPTSNTSLSSCDGDTEFADRSGGRGYDVYAAERLLSSTSPTPPASVYEVTQKTSFLPLDIFDPQPEVWTAAAAAGEEVSIHTIILGRRLQEAEDDDDEEEEEGDAQLDPPPLTEDLGVATLDDDQDFSGYLTRPCYRL